mmetsp:Transcript_16215/g.36475  ORF Transcript_16215/g.36475 Transcript_16215/m.36475 type:complete len:263 (-) Transcript_16215:909-1697(-)
MALLSLASFFLIFFLVGLVEDIVSYHAQPWSLRLTPNQPGQLPPAQSLNPEYQGASSLPPFVSEADSQFLSHSPLTFPPEHKTLLPQEDDPLAHHSYDWEVPSPMYFQLPPKFPMLRTTSTYDQVYTKGDQAPRHPSLLQCQLCHSHHYCNGDQMRPVSYLMEIVAGAFGYASHNSSPAPLACAIKPPAPPSALCYLLDEMQMHIQPTSDFQMHHHRHFHLPRSWYLVNYKVRRHRLQNNPCPAAKPVHFRFVFLNSYRLPK